jgi:hypothetical protein
MERPYIYTLFYLQYDPKQFRKEAKIRGNDYGFVHVDSFGKYYFSDDPEKLPTNRKKVLYIVAVKRVPPNAKIVKEFNELNGDDKMVAFTKDQ